MNGTTGRHEILQMIYSNSGRSRDCGPPLHVVNAFAAGALLARLTDGGKVTSKPES